MSDRLLNDEGFRKKFAAPQLDRDEADSINISESVGQAIESPLLYPPLREAVIAGDKVAIAVQPDLPHAEEMLVSVIDQLVDIGVTVDEIQVVVTNDLANSLKIDVSEYRLPDSTKLDSPPPIFSVSLGSHRVAFQVHDPENMAGLAYLAANETGEPVYVNRLMVDADFVLTIGSPIPGDSGAELDSIYPAFSGLAAQDRFASTEIRPAAKRKEAALANDMLGSFFIVQLVCAPGNIAAEVMAGVRRQTMDQSRLAVNEQWQFSHAPAPAVVATIESGGWREGWDSFADAVVFANQFLEGDGPLVIWSSIDQKPNRFVRRACNDQFESGETATKLPERYRQLASVVAERPVFLKSELGQNQTESLGLGYLESVAEVLKIANSCETGLLIRDAHRCQRKSGTVLG